jgi:hypothetical protein
VRHTFLAMCLVLSASCTNPSAGGGQAISPAALAMPIAQVDVDLGSPARTIPNDFDGFSIEVNDAAQKYLGVAGSPNTVFEQLLHNLGLSPAPRIKRKAARSLDSSLGMNPISIHLPYSSIGLSIGPRRPSDAS